MGELFYRAIHNVSAKAVLGGTILAIALMMAIFAPAIAPYNASEQHAKDVFKPPFFLKGGTWEYPLGTDNFGRDLATRALYGARISIAICFPSIFLAALVGSICGAISGYFGGGIDSLIMRVVDFQLSFPTILLAIVFAAIVGKGPVKMAIFITLALWVNYARLTRGEALKVRQLEFVLAAKVMGGSTWHVLSRHILPNALSPTLALAAVDLAAVIILEAALSYLGLGIQPPTPSWGAMISDGRNFLFESPWMSIIPGLCIFSVALGVNFLGDWLRDVTDPKLYRTHR